MHMYMYEYINHILLRFNIHVSFAQSLLMLYCKRGIVVNEINTTGVLKVLSVIIKCLNQ